LLTLSPINLSRGGAITGLATEITAPGSPNAVIRFGVYADDGNGMPSALLLDAGETAAASNGKKESTAFSPLSVGPARYWLAAVSQGTTPPSLRTNTTAHAGMMTATALQALQGSQSAYSVAFVTGSLPTLITAPVPTAAGHRIAASFG
jgi:hypothetical protein